jgi:hypothetical protein
VKIRKGRKMIIIIRRQVMSELTALRSRKSRLMKLYKGLNSTNRTKARKISVKNGFINNRNATRTKMANTAKKYREKGVLSPAGTCSCCSVLVDAPPGGVAVFCFDFISSLFIGTEGCSPFRVNVRFLPRLFIAAYIQNKK